MNNNIKNISILSEYSPTGKQFSISINKDGNDINIRTLSFLSEISNRDKIKSVLEYFPSLDILNLGSSKINYSLMLGRQKTKEYIEYIRSEIEFVTPTINSYHFDILSKRYKNYTNLIPLYYDGKLLESPVYDHSGVTGRTGIKSGFNYLTLKKEKRQSLETSNNKFLVEIDFKSCEPFFYILSQDISSEDISDVYNWISSKCGLTIKNRDSFKRGILSLMYGAGEDSVSRISGIDKQSITKIKDLLRVDEFTNKLRNEFDSKNYILNHYGRPIFSDNNLFNYWIQSSAVDFCSLSFLKFREKYKLDTHYFVHDSMTISCSDSQFDTIKNIKYLGDGLGIKIPVKIKKVLDN